MEKKQAKEEIEDEEVLDFDKPNPKERLNGKYNSKENFDKFDSQFKKRCFTG